MVWGAQAVSEIKVLPSGDELLDELVDQDLWSVVYRLPENSNRTIAVSRYDDDQKRRNTESTNTNETPPASKTDIPADESTIPPPDKNMVIIPQMGVRAVIWEGKDEKVLWKGVWRIPMTSDSPEEGNMVLTAHRYLYRPPDPRTFYLLDKLAVGDKFTVFWQGKKYEYQVRETKIVEPNQIEILYNTRNPQITLLSCTPLFTSKFRLVVVADLIT